MCGGELRRVRAVVARPAGGVDLEVPQHLGQVAERNRVGLSAVEDLGEVVGDDRVRVTPVRLLDLSERLPDRDEQHAETGERRRILRKRPQRRVAGFVDDDQERRVERAVGPCDLQVDLPDDVVEQATEGRRQALLILDRRAEVDGPLALEEPVEVHADALGRGGDAGISPWPHDTLRRRVDRRSGPLLHAPDAQERPRRLRCAVPDVFVVVTDEFVDEGLHLALARLARAVLDHDPFADGGHVQALVRRDPQ